MADTPKTPPMQPPQMHPPAPRAQVAAPGWYPIDGMSQQYWDGAQWTGNLAPLSASNSSMSADDERVYSLIMHLGGLFASFLVPLVMWLIKRDESEFIDFHGRQALNFHISLFIYGIVSFIMIFVFFIGIFMMIALAILSLVFGVIAAVKAHQGEYYRIPISIPFL